MREKKLSMRSVLAFTLVVGLVGTLHAQAGKRLMVGDPAPPLQVEAWVKGTPFKFETGKVYVLEFWATWCGPCIQSMPQLSELAEKMKGKVEVVSVNVSDRSPAGESSPGSQIHKDRIVKWVGANADKMRYNVVLDDSKDTMLKTWLSAAGQAGIPCAFVVDQEGTLAWIGHPMTGLDKAAEQVYDRKFDKGAFKKEYLAQMKPQFEAQAKNDLLIQAAKTGNLNRAEKVYEAHVAGAEHPDFRALTTIIDPLSKANPGAAVAFLQKRAKTDFKGDTSTIGSTAVFISRNVKVDKAASKALVELSLKNANSVKVTDAAIIFAYHARVLHMVGEVEAANQWLAKAASKLSAYEPAIYRDNMKKYIDDTRLRFANATDQ